MKTIGKTRTESRDDLLVYHGTTPDRIASIQRHGLLAGQEPQEGTPDGGTGGIYVCTVRAEIPGRYGELLLTLRVPRRWLRPDLSDGPHDGMSYRLVVKRVPPARIVRVTKYRRPRLSGGVRLDAAPPAGW